MAPFEFKLPDIGEGITEGEIANWLVKVGQRVKVDQDLVELMTDMGTVTIGSPRAGTIVTLPGGIGDVVPVGAVLIVLDVGGAATKDAPTVAKQPGRSPVPDQAVPPAVVAPIVPPVPHIFISHSSRDRDLVDSLVDLIEIALKVRSNEIRCTSVAGRGLPGGAHVSTRLREEIRGCSVFVAVLTEASDDSAYVMAEIGARWIVGGHAVILRGKGFAPSSVRGPLAETHSLNLGSEDDLHQLLSEIADILNITPERPHVYSRRLRDLVGIDMETALELRRGET